MNRVVSLLAACVLSIAMVSAQEVLQSEAEVKAKSFFSSRTQNAKSAALSQRVMLAHSAKTSKGAPAFYVYNNGDNDGFVIVSAEEGTRKEILGYSDKGHFDYNQIPDNLRWVLDNYAQGIDELKSASPKSRMLKRRQLAKAKATGTAVEPLLGEIEWGQRAPYNNYVPTINGEHCPAGCVAIAVGQIMFYHRWPEHGNGQVSYTWNGTKLSADLSTSVYEWDLMRNNSIEFNTDESKHAVATLVRDLGYAFRMDYNLNGSGTNFQPTVMINNFSYDRDLMYLLGNCCTTEDWENVLRSEIDAKRPVACSGFDKEGGGHQFVCDGYDAEGRFHYNFGWNGKDNGFYLSTATGYDASPDIDYNIKKDEGGKGRLSLMSPADFLYTSDNKFTCELDIYFRGSGNVALYTGFAVKNKNTDEIVYISSAPKTFSGYTSVSACTLDGDIPDGEWTVYPVAKCDDGEWQRYYFAENRQSELTLNVVDGKKTFVNDNLFDEPDEGKVEIDNVFYILNDTRKTATVTYKNFHYNSYRGDVVIPSTVNYDEKTYKVNYIGEYAFRGCTELTSVKIGKNVEAISSYSMSNIPCNVTFEEGSRLKTIESYAFYKSTMTEIKIPNGCQTIGENAFSSCNKLVLLDIPASVSSIESKAFGSCSGLKDIYVYWANPTAYPMTVFQNLNCAKIKLHIPYGTQTSYSTVLPWMKFAIVEESYSPASSLIDVVIDGMCYTLDEMALTASVRASKEGEPAASGYVTIPASLQYEGETYNVNAIGSNAFAGNKDIAYVAFGKNIETIASYAFSDCSNLEAFSFKEGSKLKTIGADAFSLCTSLIKAIIPSGCKTIEARAFYGAGNMTTLDIPASVTTIGDNAFASCSSLKDITVNWSTPLSCSDNTFADINTQSCTLHVPADTKDTYASTAPWSSFDIEEQDKWLNGMFNNLYVSLNLVKHEAVITGIKEYTEQNVYLPWGLSYSGNDYPVTTIASRAFAGDSVLTNIIIPSAVTNIEDGAFDMCTHLSSLQFDNGSALKSIGIEAFGSCYSLENFILPEGCENIGSWAFQSCGNITALNIPRSVTSIGIGAFNLCNGLANVIVNWDIPAQVSTKAFGNMDLSAVTLFVPEGTANLYAATEPWCNFFIPGVTPQHDKGDANGDGSIDVADITTIAAFILGNNPPQFDADAADVNSDGSIDIADITATAQIILTVSAKPVIVHDYQPLTSISKIR